MVVNLPVIDPILLQLGPLSIRWYGVAYLLSFLTAWWLAKTRIERLGITEDALADLVFYIALGVIIGGRVGYGLFYDTSMMARPWELFMFWAPGRSFHGGLLGVVLALWFFKRRYHVSLANLGDFISPLIPLGIGFGRLGNFFNQELWGRVTFDSPIAVIYPYLDRLPRHPSQLYEALLEGFLLFAVLWWYSAKPRAPWTITGGFFLGYGLARFVCEWFREPDAHLGLIGFDMLSMGQLLSLPMIILGSWLILYKRIVK